MGRGGVVVAAMVVACGGQATPEPEPMPVDEPAPAPAPAPVAAADADAAPPSWPGADLPDCDRARCGNRRMGMPNWTCEDGTRGGPACKQRDDGTCGWVVVRCPAAKQRPGFAKPPPRERPPDAGAPVAADAPKPKPAPKNCGDLPDDATLKTWKVIEISRPSCGPRPPPQPTKIKDLGDGTFIGEDSRRGCIRARYRRCDKKRKCLPPDTPIATPAGEVAIRELRVGMEIWTRDADGDRVRATVSKTASVPVPEDHRVVTIALADGRSVAVSAGHPDASGRGVERLRAGMAYDGSEVTRVEVRPIRAARTFDILPTGPTGVYWANGIPLRSTLLEDEPR